MREVGKRKGDLESRLKEIEKAGGNWIINSLAALLRRPGVSYPKRAGRVLERDKEPSNQLLFGNRDEGE